jgi:hypothetical protein
MAHQDELETQLAYSFSKIAPEVIGNEYLVIGTVEKKEWKKGVGGRGSELGEMQKHIADFKNVYDLNIEAGWRYPRDERKK